MQRRHVQWNNTRQSVDIDETEEIHYVLPMRHFTSMKPIRTSRWSPHRHILRLTHARQPNIYVAFASRADSVKSMEFISTRNRRCKIVSSYISRVLSEKKSTHSTINNKTLANKWSADRSTLVLQKRRKLKSQTRIPSKSRKKKIPQISRKTKHNIFYANQSILRNAVQSLKEKTKSYSEVSASWDLANLNHMKNTVNQQKIKTMSIPTKIASNITTIVSAVNSRIENNSNYSYKSLVPHHLSISLAGESILDVCEKTCKRLLEASDARRPGKHYLQFSQ